jgi:phytoene desaturase
MLADASVVVVGGGVGGLSTACYLADAGASVTLLERNEQLGGRASRLHREGFRFDMGPSWYLMPDVFERFFGHFGRRPSDYYELTRLDPHYRIFFKDGDSLDVTPNVEEMAALFESYEAGAGDALRAYLEGAEEAYEVGMEHFVYTDRPRFRDYVDLDVLRNAHGLGLLGSMREHVADYFEDPKLRQVVQYSLVFLGGSPSNTPALYKLMSHVDFNLGVYYPEGGMGAVVDALVDLGDELGVSYETGRPVTAIEGTRGDFRVHTAAGTGADAGPADAVRADAVVSDADYAHTEQELLAPEHRQYDASYWEERTYAPSAFLMYLGVEGDLDPLEHHTLVLPTDWDPHFEQIFDDPAWPDDPAYYVCAPSVTDDSVAPSGCSNLFVLVPIAAGLEDGPEVRAEYRELVLEDLAENVGLDLADRIVVEELFSVSEFASRYNSRRGTALGLAHTLRQTGPLRPDHRSAACDGLYFTGAFTRPGIGVPMCLIGGEHAASALVEDWGGTLAPSAGGRVATDGEGDGPGRTEDGN